MAKRPPTPRPTPKKGWQQRFISTLVACGNVSRAAVRAKVHRSTAYEEREKSAEFAAAWDDALAAALDLMEGEARRRAFEGTLRPVFYEGAKCGSVREYSDTLMIFLLKAHRPHLYRENTRVVHAGDPASPIKHDHDHAVSVTAEDVALARAVLGGAGGGVHPDGGPEPVRPA